MPYPSWTNKQPAAPSVGPTLNISAGDVGVAVGDSITSKAFNGNNYWWRAIEEGSIGALKGNITWIDSGVAGQTAAYFAANVNSKVIAFVPQFIIYMIGANDANTGVSPSSFRASIDAFLTSCYSALPSLKVLLAGPWIFGNLKPNGSNALDSAMDALTAQMSGAATANGIPYVNLRNGYFNGTDTVGSLDVGDGVHPSLLGATRMSAQALRQITVG